MRKTWDIFKVRIIGSLVVAAFAITLCLVSIILQNGYLGLSTYFIGMLATTAFIGLAVWLSVLIKFELPSRPTPPKLVRALLTALHNDPDAHVRFEAARELAELNVERSSLFKKHGALDEALVDALEHDPDPLVRSEAAKGLGELELEKSSFYHRHRTVKDIVYRPHL